MVEPIWNDRYWRHRFKKAKYRHLAIFDCLIDRWNLIERRHHEVLKDHVSPTTSILDAGCGWGRLIDLMPSYWVGDYCGIDKSKFLVAVARREHPTREFIVGDLEHLPAELIGRRFDLAVLISIRQMVLGNMGGRAWEAMERNLHAMCRRILYLEYDPESNGSLELGSE